METIPTVLHRSARPIRVSEFIDALRATCRPRFPNARGALHRPVALAISGGVDSMALAYLCSQIHRFDPCFKITDNPVQRFHCLLVDHGLRQGSSEEAENVCRALRDMGHLADALTINWKKELGEHVDMRSIPNMESVARRLRYRKLGKICANRRMATMLLAHHEDDQYETVSMRMLYGYRNRGLRGMSEANSIPECEGIFGAYNSGWVDDQTRNFPFYNTKLNKRQRKYFKHDLRATINRLLMEDRPAEDSLADFEEFEPETNEFNYLENARSVEIGYVPVEDGGVNIYRPLMEFSKDRLIATCVENKVPWWEDHTNKDPTLTLRNSVRHLWKNFELPKALQKPSILALAEKAKRMSRAQEAEAARLLERTILHDFQPHVGTLVVQFPDWDPLPSSGCSKSSVRYRGRLAQKRDVAGLLIRRIINLVSPELQETPLTNLQKVISWLFPSLAEPESSSGSAASPPKSFPIAGVHFMPIETTSQSVIPGAPAYPRTWYLTRLPYSTSRPPPTWRVPYWSFHDFSSRRRQRWRWSNWLSWRLYDGRFWIRMTHRLPYRVVVMPFRPDHAKSFRESLSLKERLRLNAALKKFAPGKVRYTLPAIYTEEYLDLDNVTPRVNYPLPEDEADRDEHAKNCGRPVMKIDPTKMRLMALPSLDIQLAGLDKWLLYEVRYKRADRATLYTAGTFTRGSFRPFRRALPNRRSNKVGRLTLNGPPWATRRWKFDM